MWGILKVRFTTDFIQKTNVTREKNENFFKVKYFLEYTKIVKSKINKNTKKKKKMK